MSSQPYRVEAFSWDSPLAKQARAVRHQVFVIEQNVPAEEEWDQWDALAEHALVWFEQREPAATGRLICRHGESVGKIGRMAVLQQHRGKGVGRLLLDHFLQRSRQIGLREVSLSAQEHAIPFYEKSGFRVVSEGHVEAGIPHRWMSIDL